MGYLKLLLMRHAESLGNVQKIMEGQSSTALSNKGQQQASQLAQALLSSSERPAYLYSSPLLRARQTAEAISLLLAQSSHSFLYRETDALKELHQGIFQGLTWVQAQAKYPELCERLMATLSWQTIPEAEPLPVARTRAVAWTKYLLSHHAAGDVVWVVSHEGFLQHLLSTVMGCDRTWQIRIPHTAIFEYWISLSNQAHSDADSNSYALEHFNPEHWIIRRFNDVSHLDT